MTAIDNDPLAPAFTTSPVTTAVDDAAYTYDVNANGNPAPTFSLTTAPAGMSIDPTTGIINWLPTNPGSFNVVVQAANGVLPNATQPFTINVNADLAPTAVLTRPAAGEVLSGTGAEFFGDGFDDVSTVKGEFFVDGVLGYTDVNNGNHFHFGGSHLLFNTTQYTTGSHLFRLRVTDTKGQTADAEVRATIGSGGTNPPVPLSAVSRKTHGAAGAFDINLPLTGSSGIECRSGGATGDHQLIVTFASPVTVNSNFQADVVRGIGTIGSGGVSSNGAINRQRQRGHDSAHECRKCADARGHALQRQRWRRCRRHPDSDECSRRRCGRQRYRHWIGHQRGQGPGRRRDRRDYIPQRRPGERCDQRHRHQRCQSRVGLAVTGCSGR